MAVHELLPLKSLNIRESRPEFFVLRNKKESHKIFRALLVCFYYGCHLAGLLLNKIQKKVLFFNKSIFGDWDENKQIFEGGRYRLNGGNSNCGGRANVNYNSVSNHWNNISCLPLVVLKSQKPFC